MKCQSRKSTFFSIISPVGKHYRISLGQPSILKQCLTKCKIHKAKCKVKEKLKQLLNLVVAQVQSSSRHTVFLRTLTHLIPQVISSRQRFDLLNLGQPVVSRNLASPKEKKDAALLLKYCNFPQPVPFWFACPQLSKASTKKYAEGGWGEIYRIKDSEEGPRILKIMPVGKKNPENNDENQLKFSDIIPEISALSILCTLEKGRKYRCPNFPKVYKIYCVQDRYPEKLLSTWRQFQKSKVSSTSHASPDSYPDDQAFITVEMEMCGISLNSAHIKNAMWACSIFIQVAIAFAIAEEAFQFEHRDLHSGNVLIRTCQEGYLDYRLGGVQHKIFNSGIKVSIIDFTYTRLKTDHGTMFLNLDEHVCDDPNSSKLYLDNRYIYSQMAKITGRNWSEFYPFTNNQWLKHLALILLKKLRKNTIIFEDLPRNSKQKEAHRLLSHFNKHCLGYPSAARFVREIIFDTKNISLFSPRSDT